VELKSRKWHFEVWKMTYCFQDEKEMPKNPNAVDYWLRILLSPLCALLWFFEVCVVALILLPFESKRVQEILKALYFVCLFAIFILAFLKS
jgi:hypothetical protein